MTQNQGSDNTDLSIIPTAPMDIKLVLAVLTGLFVVATLFFGTKNGFYDTDDYHGNGSAH
ncbi:hypothetical protein H6F59_09185 [Nodosilinea sp. FACHB-141]|jgi:nitrogen fixation-related uncharacterized protein|uniref:hypothetical protein n=1 Tax=Nodosilinea sp. FACHB-141 TaxID=2692833 RepID=UPI001686E91C|nr:hypothetical protein [Nodosilinea sp. FACHB-141]MBD2112001.1 hypothetical protein [Nodosilinea sp. FACHB-141]